MIMMPYHFVALSLIVLQLTSSLLVLGKPCSTCGQSCELKDPNTLICQCDDFCGFYGDCCPDAELPTQTPVIRESLETALSYIECKSRYVSLLDIAVGDSYYMVSSCPANWTTDESFALSIERNCSFSESAEFVEFPPVSDPSTGITYRNEFCAICHSVDTAQALVWPTRLRCNGDFENVSQTEEVTIELLRSYCSACSFDIPPGANNKIRETLRWCIPVDKPSCPPYSSSNGLNETNYDKLVDSCINGDYNPIHEANPFLPPGIPYETIYRNLDCALCKGVPEFFLDCLYPSNNSNDTDSDFRCTDVRGEFIIGPLPFSAILNIRGSGVISLTSAQTTGIEVITCQSNQLFDPVLGCRDIVCPAGYVPISGTCSLPLPPSPPNNFTGSGDEINPNSNTTNTLYNGTINCTTTIALNPEEYEIIDNSTVIFRQETFDIIGYDSNGQPVICIAFNQSGELITNTSTVTVLSYPPGFTELSYIGSLLSIISSILILTTYTLFKELRTLPSQLLMNMVVAFLVSDVFLILSGVVSQTVVSIELCTSVSVILHFFLLSRFSWMNCMGIQYTRTFIRAVRLRATSKNSGTNNKLLLGYVTVGWGIPLLITLVTVIINFSVEGSVRYGTDVDGEQGLCWINGKIAVILAFIVPILVSTVLNIIFFFIVIVLLCIASRSSTKERKHQQHSVQVRVSLGIFAVLGLPWVFGFIALLSNQSWAWYPFIILNSNQAVMIAICFLATKKIFLLYIDLLSKCKCESFHWKTRATFTKGTDAESVDSLANIQNTN